MIRYAILDTHGLVIGSGSALDEQDARASAEKFGICQVVPDDQVMTGADYWDGARFQPLPPLPGPWAAWDGAGWIDPRTPADRASELQGRRIDASLPKPAFLMRCMEVGLLNPGEASAASRGEIPEPFQAAFDALTSARQAELTVTSAGRAMLGLAGGSGAKVPVITGPGTAAMRDIVGNVWQSGGNPTGAIIERGSNANGEYTKYADGTVECWGRFPGETFACTTARGALFTSAFTAKPFPVSMGNISMLSCQASLIDPSGAAANLIGIKSAAGSSAEYSLSGIAVAAGTYTAVYAFHAIGRWF